MLLRVKQVANELGVSPTCVYQLISTGKLVSHRIGVGRGAIRICESDLAEFVEACRSETRSVDPTASRRRSAVTTFKHLRLDRSPD
jgi:excisionase family DNA binding protein